MRSLLKNTARIAHAAADVFLDLTVESKQACTKIGCAFCSAVVLSRNMQTEKSEAVVNEKANMTYRNDHKADLMRHAIALKDRRKL